MSIILSTVGCANFSTTATSGSAEGTAAVFGGRVHGGQQPVAFATVQIWSVGTTGYGSTGTLFATATSLDDGSGSFSFNKQTSTDVPYANSGSTWACPLSSNPNMYLIAKGGNTQGNHNASTSNSAAVFLLALGPCSGIGANSSYFMNEITTTGSIAALTQFFSPVTETIGSPSTTQALQGLANAFSTVGALVNVNTGVALGRVAHGAHYAFAETTKINTIADILAACMASPSLPSTSCTTLFTNAYPPAPAVTSQPAATFPTAADTLQSLWYMLANAADGSSARVGNLYSLVAASGSPFQPAATAQPTDWNVGITYYSIPGTADCGATAISNPNQVVINAAGIPYFVNTQSAYSGYYAISPGGTVFTCLNFNVQEVREVAFDINGGTWLTEDSAASIREATSTGNAVFFNTPVTPYVIVADGTGNIFYSDKNSGNIYEIASANIPIGSTSIVTEPTTTSTLVATLAYPALSMVADAGGNIWVPTNTVNYLYELVKTKSYAATQVGTFPGVDGSVNSMAVDSLGEILLPYYNSGPNYIAHVTPSGSTYNIGYTTGSFADNSLAVDGAGNIWTANEGSYSPNGVNSGFVVELTNSGTALIPPYGITKPANSSEFSGTLVQNETVLGTSPSIAIDLSGNVYTVNSFSNMFNTTDGEQSTVTELVGAAVPVVTPFAAALANGTIGTKP